MNALLEIAEGMSFQILAFPCNQFGLEEPGKNSEILNGLKYVRPGGGFVPHRNVHFFEKVNVNGMKEIPLYTGLKRSCPPVTNILGIKDKLYWKVLKINDINWNFDKFLVDHNGIPRYRFGKEVNPIDMLPWINELHSEIK